MPGTVWRTCQPELGRSATVLLVELPRRSSTSSHTPCVTTLAGMWTVVGARAEGVTPVIGCLPSHANVAGRSHGLATPWYRRCGARGPQSGSWPALGDRQAS